MFSSLFLLLLHLLPTSAFLWGRYHISGLENNGNLQYTVNITLGGQPIQVLIDTGRYSMPQQLYCDEMLTWSSCISSDLWVSTPIAAANDTGIQSSIIYDIGEVTGK